jgi:hypothetical protein
MIFVSMQALHSYRQDNRGQGLEHSRRKTFNLPAKTSSYRAWVERLVAYAARRR